MPVINAVISTHAKRGFKSLLRWLVDYAPVLLVLVSILFVIQILGLHPFSAAAGEDSKLPVSILAGSVADYSPERHANPIPPVNVNILGQIINEFPAGGNPQDRLSTVKAVLSTQVPTMTPYPLSTVIVSSAPSKTPPRAPVSTPTGAPLPTSTRYLTPSSAAPTLPQPTPTVTSQPSTVTPTPEASPTKTPHNTGNPNPTNTPHNTGNPGPTNTPKPPNPNNTPRPPNPTNPPRQPDPTNTPKPPKPTKTH